MVPFQAGEEINEKASEVDSSDPGPCRGNSSNIEQIRFTSLMNNRQNEEDRSFAVFGLKNNLVTVLIIL